MATRPPDFRSAEEARQFRWGRFLDASQGKFVVRVRTCGQYDHSRHDEDGNSVWVPDSVGWMTPDGGASHSPELIQTYASEADAWLHAAASGNIGSDEAGDYCWVEPVPATGTPFPFPEWPCH